MMPTSISDSVTDVNSVLRIRMDSGFVPNCGVKTCDELRLENLQALIKEAGGEDSLADRYGCTAPYIKQMARGYRDSKSGSPKGIGDAAARMLETVMGKERGWMDHDHKTQALRVAEPIAEYLASSQDERRLIEAFRFAADAQRAIALSWADANRPRESDNFIEATGTN